VVKPKRQLLLLLLRHVNQIVHENQLLSMLKKKKKKQQQQNQLQLQHQNVVNANQKQQQQPPPPQVITMKIQHFC